MSEERVLCQTLTEEERRTGIPSTEKQELTIDLVRMNGYVIFERALSPDLLASLRSAFLDVFHAHVATVDPNRGANRYQMHLPFRAPFHDPAVITNTFALPIVDALLGKDAVCHYFASDTPLPGSDYQAVHSDIALLYPEAPFSLPAYSLVVNIPLVDFTEENGPLEVWPGGTHLMPGGTDVQKLAPYLHSERVKMPAGSVLIRDMRMWHRGTPNRSTEIRPNLALIYSRPWLKTHYPPIPIARDIQSTLSDRAKHLFRNEKVV